MPDSGPVLALDVGGTHIRMAIVDSTGHIRARKRIAAHLARLPADAETNETVTHILARHIAAMLADHPDTVAIGVGFPGFIHAGVVHASPNIPGLARLPLAFRLREHIGLPTGVDNDAALAALGESRHGESAPLPFLLHVTLGTGVGGGLVLNGRTYDGEGGMALEIGHLCVRPGGRRCGCGNRGCLEAYASATGVVARWLETRQHDGDAANMDAQAVCRLARGGDALARGILEEAGDCLGTALAQAVNLLDVRHVRIGGGMCGAWDMLAAPMQRAMNASLIPPLKGTVDARPSRLGDDAALLGAAQRAREALHPERSPAYR